MGTSYQMDVLLDYISCKSHIPLRFGPIMMIDFSRIDNLSII